MKTQTRWCQVYMCASHIYVVSQVETDWGWLFGSTITKVRRDVRNSELGMAITASLDQYKQDVPHSEYVDRDIREFLRPVGLTTWESMSHDARACSVEADEYQARVTPLVEDEQGGFSADLSGVQRCSLDAELLGAAVRGVCLRDTQRI